MQVQTINAVNYTTATLDAYTRNTKQNPVLS